MAKFKVTPIAALSDNYIWCLHDEQNAYVVDPGESEPVKTFCQQKHLSLCGILVTHHHWDHTNGIEALCQWRANLPVWGPKYGNIAHLTEKLQQGQQVVLPHWDAKFDVVEVPGHTLDHIAFVGQGMVFCGDTLFSAGCGRLFEGTAEQMHQSLHKLMQLPDDTVVYCTHEYTLANLAFAQQVEPHNNELLKHLAWARTQREKGLPTVPSTLAIEKAINPFLRAHEDGIKRNVEQQVGKQLSDDDAVFKAIRQWKDHF